MSKINLIDISVVVPLYSCSKSVKELSERLVNVLQGLEVSFEIVFVNDSSPENDWEIVTQISEKDKRIKGISFSRNFGQHYAIFAGLETSTGNWVVVMDGDLQDRPEEIEKLYRSAIDNNVEIVCARRAKRNDTYIKKKTSAIFYKLFGYFTDTKYDSAVANFGIYKREVIEALLEINDKVKVFPILLQWVGFNKMSVDVIHNERSEGKSSYSYKKLIMLALSIIVSFSNKPLVLAIRFGFFMSFISFIVGVFHLYKYLNGEILISGFTSVIISIWFLSGLIIFFIGIIGVYLGKVFEATKNRPNYIIKTKLNI